MARVEVEVCGHGDMRRLLWSLGRDGERRHQVDGKPGLTDFPDLRPALAIFVPDRLALIKGPPAARRAHLDRLVAALWPGRAEWRRRYGRALAQRNALLARVRGGAASAESLDAWESELAATGIELSAARREAVSALAPEFAAAADELGLPAESELRYVARSDAASAGELAGELRERRDADLRRGHTTHGPHLDELILSLDGRAVRRFGSQGEQRAALLALLFAERRALLEARRSQPLMLLDDVMSELDPGRRELLSQRLAEGGGQVLVTATEPSQLPAPCVGGQLELRGGHAVDRAPAEPAASPLRSAARVAA